MSNSFLSTVSLDEKIETAPFKYFDPQKGQLYMFSPLSQVDNIKAETYFIDQRKTGDKKNPNILGVAYATPELMSLFGSKRSIHTYIPGIIYPYNGRDIKQGYGADLEAYEFVVAKMAKQNFEKLQFAGATEMDLSNADYKVGLESGKEEFKTLLINKEGAAVWRKHPEIVKKAELFVKFVKNTILNSDIAGNLFTLEEVTNYLTGIKTASEIKEARNKTSNLVNNIAQVAQASVVAQLSAGDTTTELSLDDLKA